MKKLSFFISLFTIISFFLSSSAQVTEEKKVTKELSAKDKEVIIEIFKTIDASLYKFQFSQEESFGTKGVSPMSAYMLRNGKIVNFPNSVSVTYFPAMNFWYAVGKTKPPGDTLEGIFGKANAARLQAIINKYTGGK